MPRIYLKDDEDPIVLKPGEYCKYNDKWYCMPPDTDLLGGLSKHEVVEHDDGTITVSPSILISRWDRKPWHGYLKKGEWIVA